MKKQQEYSMLSAAKRKMEVLVNHRTVASHPTWVRKGFRVIEKLRTKGRRRFSRAKRRPTQSICTVGIGEAEFLTVAHFLHP